MATSANAQATTKINISVQPALYSLFPIFLGTEKGWWKEVGLEPTFSSFPAGPPQIAAAAAKTWDVGGTGSAPGVLGAARFNIKTIGITNDESATNALMARPADAKEIKANPAAALKGKQVLITVNTTVDYVLNSCLKKWNIPRADVQVVNLAQAQIISGMSSGEGQMMGLWAPNIYTVEERLSAEPICTGKDAGAIVPGNLIVREDFLKENPEAAAKFLAVFLRGVAWIKANRAEAVKLMDKYYKGDGVTISRDGAQGRDRSPPDVHARRAGQDVRPRQRRLDRRRLVQGPRRVPAKRRHAAGRARRQELPDGRSAEAHHGRRETAQLRHGQVTQEFVGPCRPKSPVSRSIPSGQSPTNTSGIFTRTPWKKIEP